MRGRALYAAADSAAFFFGAAERVADELDHVDRLAVALEAALAQPMSIGIEFGALTEIR